MDNNGTHTTTSDIMNEQCFELFVEGLQFEDSWKHQIITQAGDIVTYGGYQYVAERTNNNVVLTTTL